MGATDRTRSVIGQFYVLCRRISITHSCGPECSRDQTLFPFQILTETRALSWDNSHDLVSKLPKESYLSGQCHKVGNHVAGWTPLDSEFLLIYLIRYKVITDVNMLCALAARCFAILYQKHGTSFVLIENVLSDVTSLSLDKISCPADGWHAVIHSDQLGFG